MTFKINCSYSTHNHDNDSMRQDLDNFAYNTFTAGYPLSTCLFYNRYCDYATELYKGVVEPLSFDDVDEYIVYEMEIVSINDEYCP